MTLGWGRKRIGLLCSGVVMVTGAIVCQYALAIEAPLRRQPASQPALGALTRG